MPDRCTCRWQLLFVSAFLSACGGNSSSPRGEAGSSAAPLAGTAVGGMTVLGGSGGAGSVSSGGVGGGGGQVQGGVGAIAGGGGATSGTGGAAAVDAGVDSGPGGAADAGPDAERPPPVDLPAGVRAMFPLPGAQDVCIDPPLRIELTGAPVLGDRGRVRIWSDADASTPRAELDLAVATAQRTIGGETFQLPRAAYVDGNSAVFYLAGALARGEDYHVTIEAGALSGPDGAFAIADATTWRFSTAASGPSDRAKLSVAVSGGAPFCTVQAALDAVPANNTTPTAIELASGTYHEVLYVRGKDNLTLRGADRKRTVIAAVNNNNLNPATRTRALVGVDDASGLVVETLTIHNLTPQGGSQAEALRLQGCDRCVVRDADILSLQDTLLWSGRLYAEDCLIAGNVDFIWGTGAAYFTRCEIKTVGRAGYIVQARNGAAGNGYVFVDSKLTSDAGITGNVLGRVDASVYPQSHVAYVDCELGAHISAAGWTVTGGAGSALRFWEYGSKSPSGQPIDTSQRHAASTQLTSAQAEMMRDPAMVLGGWQPPVR